MNHSNGQGRDAETETRVTLQNNIRNTSEPRRILYFGWISQSPLEKSPDFDNIICGHDERISPFLPFILNPLSPSRMLLCHFQRPQKGGGLWSESTGCDQDPRCRQGKGRLMGWGVGWLSESKNLKEETTGVGIWFYITGDSDSYWVGNIFKNTCSLFNPDCAVNIYCTIRVKARCRTELMERYM